MKKIILFSVFLFMATCIGKIYAQDDPVPATVPYYCGFEDEEERNNWNVVSPDFYNQWMLGTSTHSEGNYSLYVGFYLNTTNSYDISFASTSWAYRDIFIDSTFQECRVAFDFKGMGEKIGDRVYDYLNIYVGPPADVPYISYDNSNPIITPPEGATLFVEKLCMVSTWTHYEFSIDASFSGVQRIYFLWRNDGGGGTQPPAAIDNLSVTPASCAKPSHLTANVMDTTLVLSWDAVDGANSYTILYKESSDSNYIEFSSSYNYIVINDFQYETSYDWKVRSNCSDDEYSLWSESSFHTLHPVAHLPYNCDFEDSTEAANWLFFENDRTNQWFIGSDTSNIGETTLFISNDGGITNAYTLTTGASTWACRDIFIPDTIANYTISFDFKGIGETYNSTKCDYLQLFVGPPTIPTGYDIPEGAIALSDKLNETGEWTTIQLMNPAGYSGMQRLYFLWANDGSWGTNPPAAIDNIVIIGSTCPAPVELSASSVLDHSAELTWLPANPSVTYTLAYKAEEDSLFTEITVNTNSYHLSGLQPSTNYIWKVKTHCSANDESIWSVEQSFRTYSMLGRIPYSCDFEDADENAEWLTSTTTGTPHWQIGTAVYQSSNHSLYVGSDQYNYIPEDEWITWYWTYRDIYFDPSFNEYELSLYHQCGGQLYNGTDNTFKVFIGPPATPNWEDTPEGAELLGTITRDLNWNRHTYTIDQHHQGLQRLYFLWGRNTWYNDNPPSAVDDIAIVGVSCGRPLSVITDTIGAHEIGIHFTPCTPDDHTWEVAIMEAGGSWTDAESFVIQDTSYTFTNLNGNTMYSIYVRTVCGNNDYSVWTSPLSLHTGCAEIVNLPYTEYFDTYGAELYPWCWTRFPYSNGFEVYPMIFTGNSSYILNQLPSPPSYFALGAEGAQYSMAILPPFSTDIPINSLIIRYWYEQSSPLSSLFSVGVMEDPENESTFVPIRTLHFDDWGSDDEIWVEDTVFLSSYTGNGHYIAFKFTTESEGEHHFLFDNLVIDTSLVHTGVANINDEPDIILYPNPTNDIINIRLQEESSDMTEAEIYDVNGRLLRSLQTSGRHIQIPVANFAQGMYFVKIRCGNKTAIKRFVKQ